MADVVSIQHARSPLSRLEGVGAGNPGWKPPHRLPLYLILTALLFLPACGSLGGIGRDTANDTADRLDLMLEKTAREAEALVSQAGQEARQTVEASVATAGSEARQIVAQAVTQAGQEARDIVADAGTRSEALIEKAAVQADALVEKTATSANVLVEKAGMEARGTVDRAAVEFEDAGKAVMDRAGDRLDASVDKLGDRMDESIRKIPEATAQTTQQAEDFLDTLGSFWKSALFALVTAVGGIGVWIYRLRSLRYQRTAQHAVKAIEESEGADDVKAKIGEKLASEKDRHVLEAIIRKLKA